MPPDSDEPDGEPWPAAGHAGPPRCRPLSTIAELLTWQAPPTTTRSFTDSPSSLTATTAVDTQPETQTQQQRQGETQHHASPPQAQQQQPAVQQQSSLCPADPCCSKVPLQSSTRHISCSSGQVGQQRPQLLLCHDMMGGYLPQDALLSGSNDHRYVLGLRDAIQRVRGYMLKP